MPAREIGWGVARCSLVLWAGALACAASDDGAHAGTTAADDTASATASQADGVDATGDDAHVTGTSAADTGASTDQATDDGDTDTTTATGTDTGTTGGEPLGDAPDYAAVQQKSAHNAYQRHEAIIDQLVYHRVRSIELDIHTGKSLEPTVQGDWYVYHTDIVDDATTCRRLSDCLGEVSVLAEAVADHEVVTLWIDLKDDFGEGHRPVDLDAMLEASLGAAIFAPDELRDACPGAIDLAGAASDAACGWPGLDALRGRVIVALTGGGVSDPGSRLSAYASEGTVAFVAPDVTGSPALTSPHPQVAIYNASSDELDAAADAVAAGFVTRVWGCNDAATWNAAAALGVQHLATDMVNLHEDPWAITHDAAGWPFRCPGGCDGVGPEPGVIVGIEVDSGDIWGTSDDFSFLHVDDGEAPAADEWVALVATPNSHVEPFAKGCLMARAGLEPDAAYLAVCRPADEEPLRAQLRPSAGAESEAVEHDIASPDTVSPSSVAWLRLVVDEAGTCASAFGARHFGEWIPIASHCFAEPLTHRGLAASSHDAGPVRLLFVAPQRSGAELTLGQLTTHHVGTASAIAFEGPIP